MHHQTHSTHHHQFDQGNPLAQKRILWATILTAVMMLFEVLGGWFFQSMALLADGWHMSSHVLALGLAFSAYHAARYYASDARFNLGTWRIEILAGYSSAILLFIIALYMAFYSVERLFFPMEIHYNEAILIAILGLIVNVICAWLLHDDHHHHQVQNESHAHHDLNQKAAFVHVIADALTSILAIIALCAGKFLGWDMLDSILGILGSVLVALWAISLIKQTAKTLLDADMDAHVVKEIREVIYGFPFLINVDDLHVTKVGKDLFSCAMSLSTSEYLTADQVKRALAIHDELVHITVEINQI